MTAHKHAAILAQAAEEAQTDAKFYEKWEYKSPESSKWDQCSSVHMPGGFGFYDYRRKPAKPRECWAVWKQESAAKGLDPWRSVWPFEFKSVHPAYKTIHMIEATPEVRGALAAAGIEVSQ